jgi:hypothetical protein
MNVLTFSSKCEDISVGGAGKVSNDLSLLSPYYLGPNSKCTSIANYVAFIVAGVLAVMLVVKIFLTISHIYKK